MAKQNEKAEAKRSAKGSGSFLAFLDSSFPIALPSLSGLHFVLGRLADPAERALLALGNALDLKDRETAGHSRRVCRYSLEIAKRLNCTPAELKVLRQGALLHDIGKLAVPDSILHKPARLTPEEWTIVKAHVTAGYELVREVPSLEGVAELILTHHERHDGSGYPTGLKGDEIPLCARIFAVADSFDAMTTPRPYQAPIPVALAVEEIRRQAGRSFDAQITRAFLEIPEQTLETINSTVFAQIVRPQDFSFMEARPRQFALASIG